MNSLEVHVIQTFSPSRLNRGENGDPKTIVMGGVTRTRHSSQAIKKTQRDQSVTRTRIPQTLVADHLRATQDVSSDLLAVIRDLLAARYGAYDENGRLKIMVALHPTETAQFADLTAGHQGTLLRQRQATLTGTATEKKRAAAEYQDTLKALLGTYRPQVTEQTALYGRFVADQPDEIVTAATAYAHAISTHRDQSTPDFFSAVDDLEGKSAHIGTLGLSAPTMYRFAMIDLDQLERHLGPGSADAARRWVSGYLRAAPTGARNSAFGQTLPEYALLIARTHGHPVTLANAFTEPAYPQRDVSLLQASVTKLKDQLAYNQRVFSTNGLTHAAELSVRPFPHALPVTQADTLEDALRAVGL